MSAFLSLGTARFESNSRRDSGSTSPLACAGLCGTRAKTGWAEVSPTSLQKSGRKAERAHGPVALFRRSNLISPTSRCPPHSPPRPSPRLALQRIDEQCLSLSGRRLWACRCLLGNERGLARLQIASSWKSPGGIDRCHLLRRLICRASARPSKSSIRLCRSVRPAISTCGGTVSRFTRTLRRQATDRSAEQLSSRQARIYRQGLQSRNRPRLARPRVVIGDILRASARCRLRTRAVCQTHSRLIPTSQQIEWTRTAHRLEVDLF